MLSLCRVLPPQSLTSTCQHCSLSPRLESGPGCRPGARPARALRPRACARVPANRRRRRLGLGAPGWALSTEGGRRGPCCPAPAALTLLSCWWMSCFSSEAFSGGSDMLGPASHRASPRFGCAPASPGKPVAAEQSRRDRLASRSSREARRRVRAGAGREPRQRRRSTVAFNRRGLPGLGLPPSLPDHLRLPLPSLGVPIPRAQRSPSACPARVSAGTARPHLSPVAGPFRPADRHIAGRALQDPTPSRTTGPAPPRPRR